MLIRYVCECCDRLVEEIIVSEDLINLLNDEESPAALTGISPQDIIGLESQGSLVLETMCPECLDELSFEDDGTPTLKTNILN